MTFKFEPITDNEIIESVKHTVEQDEAFDDKTPYEEIIETLLEAVRRRPPVTPISEERVREIVNTYAPNAPHRADTDVSVAKVKQPEPIKQFDDALPVELENVKPLSFHDGYWWGRYCRECHNFNQEECCGQQTQEKMLTRPEDGVIVMTKAGKQAAGLIPVEPPKPPKPKEERWQESSWWKSFSGADELEDGGVKMFIENFLPEGVTLICGLPKEGKSFLALSIVKALTSGKLLFTKSKFIVPEAIPVLYLAAEVSDRAFKQRLKKFGITNDKTRFLCRTLSKGPRLGLNHPDVEAIVGNMKPIIILDTIVRFNSADDEDDAAQNQKLADAIFYLRALGARAVIGLHHSRKDIKDGEPTLEKAVRGTGDLAAMCDVVWALVRDERLYKNNSGPNEVNVIGWGRDFNAEPFRLALTKRAPTKTMIGFAPGIVSVIDEIGDLGWVDKAVSTNAGELEQLVQTNPNITIRELEERTGLPYKAVQRSLKKLGWTKGRGWNGQWQQAAA